MGPDGRGPTPSHDCGERHVRLADAPGCLPGVEVLNGGAVYRVDQGTLMNGPNLGASGLLWTSRAKNRPIR
jgi:hypothetical protein